MDFYTRLLTNILETLAKFCKDGIMAALYSGIGIRICVCLCLIVLQAPKKYCVVNSNRPLKTYF